jgi:hypothetical protein
MGMLGTFALCTGMVVAVVVAVAEAPKPQRLDVTTVTTELETVKMEDVGDGVVREAQVVGDDDGCVVSEASKIVLKPGNVNNIQVVSWLIE